MHGLDEIMGRNALRFITSKAAIRADDHHYAVLAESTRGLQGTKTRGLYRAAQDLKPASADIPCLRDLGQGPLKPPSVTSHTPFFNKNSRRFCG